MTLVTGSSEKVQIRRFSDWLGDFPGSEFLAWTISSLIIVDREQERKCNSTCDMTSNTELELSNNSEGETGSKTRMERKNQRKHHRESV